MRDNSFRSVVLILALLYIISPIDLIPDVIPVVGWIDDLVVALGAGAVALSAGSAIKCIEKQNTSRKEHPYGHKWIPRR